MSAATKGRAPAEVRARAARVVEQVAQGRSLAELLPQYREGLVPEDQSLLAELAQGTCRWIFRLRHLLRGLLQKPLKARDSVVESLLLVGLYQLAFTAIPPHAAVAETAEAARRSGRRWAVGVVNGVLRRFWREKEARMAAAMAEPQARFGQPRWFLKAVREAWAEEAEAIFEGLLERPPFTLRVALDRTTPEAEARRLARMGVASRPVSGVTSALRLDRALPVSRLPGFREGLVSVQDAGAQLAAGFLDPRPGMAVLDACAAPGGKTGHLLERCPDLDLVAVDRDAARLDRVRENLRRLRRRATLEVGDAASAAGRWAERRYHRILADVPCTATGVMRRHPDIRLLRRAEDVPALVDRQREILDRLWRLLRPGGKLLYATCSLLPAENELQIRGFLDRHPDARALPLASPLGRPTGHGLQLLPVTRDTDGFYYALLERTRP